MTYVEEQEIIKQYDIIMRRRNKSIKVKHINNLTENNTIALLYFKETATEKTENVEFVVPLELAKTFVLNPKIY